MGLGAITDKLIEPFFPGWTLSRAKARAQLVALSTYAAAEKNRLNKDRRDRQTSADGAILPDNATINARAREMSRDHWAGTSISDAYRRHVTGTGITGVSTARDASGKLMKDWNRQVNSAWKRWSEDPRQCDVEATKTVVEQQGMAIEEFVTVGQAFAVLVYEPQPGRSGLRVQWVEPEQLDVTLTRNPTNGNEIRAGIEVDKYCAPVAYWFYTDSHPYDYTASRTSPKSEPVEASRVLHFFRPRRPRQTQGVSRYAPILDKLSHLVSYDQYMLIRARYEAAFGCSVETNSDYGVTDLPSLAEPTVRDDGAKELTIQPGMILDPGPGRKINFHSPVTPGNNYDPFTRRQISEIGAGAGLDFATLLRDYSQGNFSSQRQGTLDRDKETDGLQLLLISQVLRPLREFWLMLEILEGRIEAPGFFADPAIAARYLECQWQAPPKPWVDPANQARAASIGLDYKILSRTAIANEQGTTIEDVFDLIEHEYDLAEEKKLGLPDAPVGHGGKPEPAPAFGGFGQSSRPQSKAAPDEDEPDEQADQEPVQKKAA